MKKLVNCPECGGTGWLDLRCHCWGLGSQYECPACGDSGISHSSPCEFCQGTGTVIATKQVVYIGDPHKPCLCEGACGHYEEVEYVFKVRKGVVENAKNNIQ